MTDNGIGRSRRHWLFTLAGSVLFAIAAVTAAAPPLPDTPFKPGEAYRYVFKWASIPVGEARVRVEPMTTMDGVRAWHFVVEARTSGVVDALFKVRDRAEAFCNERFTRSLRYHQKQREGFYRREFDVRFDYSKLIATRTRNGQKPKTIPIHPLTLDPISAFFALRSKRLRPGTYLSAPISDGKKSVIGVVRVVRRETITIDSGTYDTFLLFPDLHHVGGVIRKTRDAKLKVWITADGRHIPVKAETKVVVGHFVAELEDRP